MKKRVSKKVSKKPAKNGNSVVAIIPELSKQPSIQQVLKLAYELSEKVNLLSARLDALTPTPTPVKQERKAKAQKPQKRQQRQQVDPEADVDRNAIVDKLDALLQAKTIKVADIAKFVGIASSSVSCWLHGVSLPAKRHLAKVSQLLQKYAA